MLGPRADDDVQALLSLISPDDAGFLRLARLLSDRETDSLPSGLEASIWDLAEAEPVKPRVWKGVAPPADQFTLARLGLDDLTVHGFRGGVIEVPLHYLPDEAVVSGIASVDLVFSFANQIVEGSRLRIYLNHEILAEKVLTDLPGTARQRVSVGLPTARLGPMSSLQLHFDLRGHEAESCLGAAHAQLWATVHADTRVTMPRRKVTRILDLSLLRFGAFPLGLRADLSELLFLLPRAPAEPELRAAAVLAAELGRLARADRVSFDLRFGSDIPEALSKRDLVIVGALGAPSPRVDGAASSSASTLLPAAWAEDGEGGKKASAGILMEIDESPLDDDYNALTLTLPGLASLSALDACPGAPRLLERVVGRVARLSGCEGHEVVTGRSIPFEGTTPIREGAERWVTLNYWTFLEVFALLVLLVLLLRYLVREIGRHLAGRAAEKRGETEWQE
jgi:hypothetical protein